MKNHLLENANYTTGHPQYRKAYLVNVVFLLLFFVTVMFAFLNLVIIFHPLILAINLATALLSISAYLFFRKGKNVDLYAYIAVVLVTLAIGSFILAIGNEHFGLMWLCPYPPVVYFLLGRKKGRIITIAFCLLILLYILLSGSNWMPAEFTTESVFNITGSIFALIMMISFYEQSRQDFSKRLEDKTNELLIILDSTDNAIFGIDQQGICTFCNKSAIFLLGFKSDADMLGMDVFDLLGKNIDYGKSEDLFFRKDNTFFYAEYNLQPHIVDSKITGSIVTLRDITEKKADSDRIRYLGTHDSLTGLYNRYGFDEKVRELDSSGILPITVVFCDVNNLKLANDIFGHKAGDQLLYNCSKVIKDVFTDADVLSRIGGDEFVILLAGKAYDDIEEKIRLVKQRVRETDFFAFKSGISVGHDLKINKYQSIETILGNAETKMYRDKIKNRKDLDSQTLNEILENLHKRSPREKYHSQNVSNYCKEIALAMKLDGTQSSRAERAGYYHDIGKIILPDEILIMRNRNTLEQRKIYFQHPAAGYRILSMTDATLDLADSVYLHHERWDGSGFPKGLKGDDIPLVSRIIAVAEAYDEMTNTMQSNPLSCDEALIKLDDDIGKLDPDIVELFIALKTDVLS